MATNNVNNAGDDAIQAAHAGVPRPWKPAPLVAAAALLSALAAAAFLVDLPIARLVKEQGLPGELKRLIRLSETFGWGGTVALIILTAAIIDLRGWRIGLPLAVSAFGAGALADGIKLFVARWRPSSANLAGHVSDTFLAWLPVLHQSTMGNARGYAVQSFPSSHAATAVGLAAALAALYPRGRWLFAMFAVLAGIQRIEAQAHFASDVLAGAAIGCIVAAACQRICCRSNCPVS